MQEVVKDRYIIDYVMVDDTIGALKQLIRKLARKLDQEKDPRAITSLSKQFREALSDLAKLEAEKNAPKVADEQEKVSQLHALQSKQATRIPGAKNSTRAKAS